jgi:hypothetical protein
MAEMGMRQFSGVLGKSAANETCRSVAIPSIQLDEVRATACSRRATKMKIRLRQNPTVSTLECEGLFVTWTDRCGK